MPGSVFHVGGGAICPHAGQVSVMSTNTRVMVSGQPVATASDTFLIAGCPFNVASSPQPCLTIRWLVPSLRVRVNGQPVVLQTSTGLCQSAAQVPQGPPNIVAVQLRVSGS
jgi:uncharacterized Zn-binding protein involved in type VI secretion